MLKYFSGFMIIILMSAIVSCHKPGINTVSKSTNRGIDKNSEPNRLISRTKNMKLGLVNIDELANNLGLDAVSIQFNMPNIPAADIIEAIAIVASDSRGDNSDEIKALVKESANIADNPDNNFLGELIANFIVNVANQSATVPEKLFALALELLKKKPDFPNDNPANAPKHLPIATAKVDHKKVETLLDTFNPDTLNPEAFRAIGQSLKFNKKFNDYSTGTQTSMSLFSAETFLRRGAFERRNLSENGKRVERKKGSYSVEELSNDEFLADPSLKGKASNKKDVRLHTFNDMYRLKAGHPYIGGEIYTVRHPSGKAADVFGSLQLELNKDANITVEEFDNYYLKSESGAKIYITFGERINYSDDFKNVVVVDENNVPIKGIFSIDFKNKIKNFDFSKPISREEKWALRQLAIFNIR